MVRKNALYEVEALMDDYERDFGVRVSFEDADRMLTLYDELADLLCRYMEEDNGEISFITSPISQADR